MCKGEVELEVKLLDEKLKIYIIFVCINAFKRTLCSFCVLFGSQISLIHVVGSGIGFRT